MDRNTEKRYDEALYALDSLKDEINRLEKELFDLQNRYEILEQEKEESYKQGYNEGYNEGANAAATDILG